MTKPNCFEDAVQMIVAELAEVLVSKQGDYGHSNITDFGEYGVLIRANDKLARLKHLILPNGVTAPNNEPINDSWKDLANYAIIALMYRRGWFELSLTWPTLERMSIKEVK